MNAFRNFCGSVAIAAVVLAGCAAPHGQPAPGPEVLAPNDVADFNRLYAENCAGCHGAEGKGGPAVALSDPVFLAIANEAEIRKVVASGMPGTAMPAFAQNAGGMLTDKQIEIISTGIRSRWGQEVLTGANLPTYAATLQGDAHRGELVYQTYCESCHGANGSGSKKGSAITDDSFLALVSNQALRSIVITGRPELGAPDWRGNVPGKPMSDQEVTDVVAWLASRRVPNPGRPYAISQNVKP